MAVSVISGLAEALLRFNSTTKLGFNLKYLGIFFGLFSILKTSLIHCLYIRQKTIIVFLLQSDIRAYIVIPMKRPAHRQNKVPKLFKLHPAMVLKIKKEALRSGKTQTKIVETALEAYFAVKH